MTKKIVVIDDEQDILEIIKATLKTKGYYVYPADNGEDGWHLIQQQHPDLVISDLKMPKISGLELSRRLRSSEEFKNVPLIIISGIGHETGKSDEFWRMGLKADDFIAKPFDPLDLLGRIEFIFRRKEYISSGSAAKPSPLPPPPEVTPVQTAPSLSPAPSKPPSHIPSPPARKERSPEDVVRDFVESWNTQNFPLEYQCLAEEMTGGLREQDYVRRRLQAYQDTHGQYQIQSITKVEESSITRQMAKVVILREDKKGSHITQSRQTFVLRKMAQSRWGIVSVKTQPL